MQITNKTTIPPLSIIVAVDEDGGFGKDGKIPWNIPEDMAHFKEVTSGGVCIMGRKTYEDMLNMLKARKKSKKKLKEILPGRESFVVTSDVDYKAEGATAVQNIRNAIAHLDKNDHREIFVLGGYRMFIEALPWTSTIYMTIVKNEKYQCDKFFPIEVLNNRYKIVDGKETKKLYFVTYKRG